MGYRAKRRHSMLLAESLPKRPRPAPGVVLEAPVAEPQSLSVEVRPPVPLQAALPPVPLQAAPPPASLQAALPLVSLQAAPSSSPLCRADVLAVLQAGWWIPVPTAEAVLELVLSAQDSWSEDMMVLDFRACSAVGLSVRLFKGRMYASCQAKMQAGFLAFLRTHHLDSYPTARRMILFANLCTRFRKPPELGVGLPSFDSVGQPVGGP